MSNNSLFNQPEIVIFPNTVEKDPVIPYIPQKEPNFVKKNVTNRHFSHLLLPFFLLLWTGLVFASGIGLGYWTMLEKSEDGNNPDIQGEKAEKTYPLLKYSFPELAQRQPQTSPIQIKRVIKTNPEFTSYVFNYESEGKTISGLMNIPKSDDSNKNFPVILMLRGFVPEETYAIGAGTIRAGEAFAKQGYITLAPDFLGFGESDPQPGDSLESRFIKPMNILDLISSIESFHMQPLIFNKEVAGRFDSQKLGIWGHSNGGQIALSILEITGKSYPTTLWAPVTKPFPYSVLYFTDESEDFGRSLRSVLSNFEQDYDVEQFTIGKYMDKITAKIQLHQGTADDAVPVTWSDQFVRNMDRVGKKDLVEYFVYQNADHSLQPGWDQVVQRNFEFFRKELIEKSLATPTPEATVSASPVATESALPIVQEQVSTPSGSVLPTAF